MLKRLQQKQSNYNVIDWHKKENERKKLMQNIKNYREIDEKIHTERME